MSPVAFSILGFEIYWYGLAYALSFVLCLQIAKFYVNKFHLSLTQEQVDDCFVIITLSIIGGGRLGYFLFYEPALLIKELFFIRNGGMSFHGAVLLTIITTFHFAKKQNIEYLLITDLIATICPLGIFFGRIGNYLNNNEIPGRVLFGAQHPVVLYEAFFEGVVLFVFLNYIYVKNHQKTGKNSAFFMLFYSFFRFFLDFLKDQPITFWLLSTGQILCVPMFVVSLHLLCNE